MFRFLAYFFVAVLFLSAWTSLCFSKPLPRLSTENVLESKKNIDALINEIELTDFKVDPLELIRKLETVEHLSFNIARSKTGDQRAIFDIYDDVLGFSQRIKNNLNQKGEFNPVDGLSSNADILIRLRKTIDLLMRIYNSKTAFLPKSTQKIPIREPLPKQEVPRTLPLPELE